MTDRITDEQLSRLAIVYVRQSSPGQVRNHRESTERPGTKTVRQGNNRVDSAGYAPKGATVRIVINKGSNAELMSNCPVRRRR